MAYVAFDLDNTLGFFEFTNPLAYLWSPEFLNNPEQSKSNHSLRLSTKLKAKLKRARDRFVESLLADHHLLQLVLRPNLDAILEPLVASWRAGKVRAVIMYSNTSVSYSLELAKALIEHKYNVPGMFHLLADHWHPSRTADRPTTPSRGEYVEPLKTITTLERLFRESIGTGGRLAKAGPKHIPLQSILFVDDRQPKHALEAQESGGLTYLVPSRFVPKATVAQRRRILLLAIEAINRAGLMVDDEYLDSGFCYRDIPYDWTRTKKVRGAPQLFEWVWDEIHAVRTPRVAWQPDTDHLAATTRDFLGQFSTS